MLSKRKKISLLLIYVVGMFILPLFLTTVAMFVGLHVTIDSIEEVLNVTTTVIVLSYGGLTFVLLLLTRSIFKQDFIKINSWKNFIKQMVLGIICTFSAAVVGGILVQLFGVNEMPANQKAVEAALGAMPFAMILSVVVFAPIVEEIIFRLVIMQLFNWKPLYNILFSSFIFGLMHLNVGGGFIHIIPYFLMGSVFGFVYHKNDNIWHVTILHMLHNGLSAAVLFMGQGLLT